MKNIHDVSLRSNERNSSHSVEPYIYVCCSLESVITRYEYPSLIDTVK